MRNPSEAEHGGGGDGLSPVKFEFSTEPIRRPERFDYYCESTRSNYLGFDVGTNGSNEFHGSMRGFSAGDAVIMHTSLSPACFKRTRRSTLDRDDSIIVVQTRTGFGRLNQAGMDFILKPGAFTIYPSTIPGLIEVLEQTVHLSVKLPRAMVETLLQPGHVIAPGQLPPSEPTLQILSSYVLSCARSTDGMSATARRVAGHHIADLVALVLGASRDAQAEIAEGGLKAARIDAILAAIARGFASPLVSPATIGASLGVSERHVHRLLEHTNRTFYEHLLEARLSHAYQMLTQLGGDIRSITHIAADSGFSNLSYFSRVFRQRFGDTPVGVRRTSKDAGR